MTNTTNPIESLEPRRLLAADPTFELSPKGTLVVHGSSKSDSIEVSLLHGKAADGFRAILDNKAGSHEARFKFKSVKRIYIEAAGGDDSIFVGGGTEQTRPATVLGGAGNDKINHAFNASIFASGGSGNDVVGATAVISVTSTRDRDVIKGIFAVQNKTAVNTLQGDAGNDTLSGDTNDSVDGGGGTDTAVLTIAATVQTVPQTRADSLATSYYSRLGATSIEATEGAYLFGSVG